MPHVCAKHVAGLFHAADQRLIEVLHVLADAGNTAVVIERNLEVIKTADWVSDMGPQGGDGGQLVPKARKVRTTSVRQRSRRPLLARS
jgi:excinuclease ABC subunit A